MILDRFRTRSTPPAAPTARGPVFVRLCMHECTRDCRNIDCPDLIMLRSHQILHLLTTCIPSFCTCITVQICKYPDSSDDCAHDIATDCMYETLDSVVHVTTNTCITVSHDMSGFNVQSVLCDGLDPSNATEEPLASAGFVKAYQCFGVPLTSSLSTQVQTTFSI
jgi:hypothetical protein